MRTRRLGALEVRAIDVPKGRKFLHTPVGDALRLFCLDGIEHHIARFDELGIGDLLNPELNKERIFGLGSAEVARICGAVGAKVASIETFTGSLGPREWTKFGNKKADAWFLAIFTSFYSWIKDPSCSPEGRNENGGCPWKADRMVALEG